MVTEALASRLSTAPDLWIAGCGTSGDPKLAETVRWLRPDVITIEVESLGPDIGRVLQELKAAWPAAHVVVVSAGHDIGHAVAAAKAGADAWVPTDQGADDLENVIRGVCRGHSWFPSEMLGEILHELRDDISRAAERSDPLDVLSPRERDVLAGMAEGRRGPQIAEDLAISTDTVRTHTNSIFAKLNVHSRLEAVSVARAAGLGNSGHNGAGGTGAGGTGAGGTGAGGYGAGGYGAGRNGAGGAGSPLRARTGFGGPARFPDRSSQGS
jgi:DNA-binding NarL/FixJ family response regulator